MEDLPDKLAQLQDLVTFCEDEIRTIFFSHRFISNNVKRPEQSKIFMCFLCLGPKFDCHWKWNYSSSLCKRFIGPKCSKFPCLYLCSSTAQMGKHTNQVHPHALQYKSAKSMRVVNANECYTEISPYLDSVKWNSAFDSYASKYYRPLEVDDVATAAGASIDVLLTNTTSTALQPMVEDKTSPSKKVELPTTVPILLTPMESTPPTTHHKNDLRFKKFPLSSKRGRFWPAPYYTASSYEEARRIVSEHQKMRALIEAARERARPRFTLAELVDRDFHGDIELYSDHVTWVEDEDLESVTKAVRKFESGKRY